MGPRFPIADLATINSFSTKVRLVGGGGCFALALECRLLPRLRSFTTRPCSPALRRIEAPNSGVSYVRNTSTPVIWRRDFFDFSDATADVLRGRRCGCFRSDPAPTSFRPPQEPYTHCH